MRTLIIDDESKARSVLRAILERFHPELELVGEAGDIKEAVDLIHEHEPDLLFLDVEMPGGSGFNLLEKFPDPPFDVIFTTAYPQYAVQAIRHAAFDYLVKPIVRDELAESLGRLRAKQPNQTKLPEQTKLLKQLLARSSSNKIYLPDASGIHVVEERDIIRCEAEGNYCMVYTSDKKKYTLSKTLKEIEKMLDTELFFRVHYSTLINLNHIQRISNVDGGQVQLSDGSSASISKRRKKEFLQVMGLG